MIKIEYILVSALAIAQGTSCSKKDDKANGTTDSDGSSATQQGGGTSGGTQAQQQQQTLPTGQLSLGFTAINSASTSTALALTAAPPRVSPRIDRIRGTRWVSSNCHQDHLGK